MALNPVVIFMQKNDTAIKVTYESSLTHYFVAGPEVLWISVIEQIRAIDEGNFRIEIINRNRIPERAAVIRVEE